MTRWFTRSIFAATIAVAGTIATFAQETFPVTVSHAFGETTVEDAPQRIVTWGWAAQDAVIALGQVPVAIPYFEYGGDEQGMLAWTKEAIAGTGAGMPTILQNTQSPPIEQIAALQPDLIVAVYSGITEDEYALLSQIAPVVAYPDDPWSTPWQQTITLTGEVLGKRQEAQDLVERLETFIADEVAQYPEIDGTSFAAIAEYNNEVAVYAALDSRVKFLADLGMVVPQSVETLAQGNEFFFSLSFERFNELASDILISYFESDEEADAFYERPYIALSPQVEEGAVASIIGAELINSISPPSALSLEWGFPQYIAKIAEAARNAKAED
ncbi:periplasmic binding protein [Devosia pacifica]|uniref:Periplasmic binding protein n=1 Tax=Devosia pacifica TaxID=1335967 RepID=A0A918SEW8_9HYPH|nr:ABC transporter substrate-binding protein [Devosia pacifica]GHA36854.1 periplasmic binding protein [Devosia pacifica]